MDLKPNYFDKVHEDGQTPSNTPSNKGKGTLNYNMNDFSFKNKLSKEIENINLTYNNDENNNDNDDEQKEQFFCSKIILGKLPLGHFEENENNNKYQIYSCSKLYCNKCDHKVTYIADNKFKNTQTIKKMLYLQSF